MIETVHVYTDGACRGNPGAGGWGALLVYEADEQTISGAEPHTTNNRMELMAAIMALKTLPKDMHVVLTTDSQYVRNGITQWIKNWKRRGWKTAQGKPVKNIDLWQQLDNEILRHEVHWHWVRGHSGHRENEMADKLATEAIDTL